MTENRRGAFRSNAFTFGALLLAGGEVGCLVWDATEAGAQIEVPDDQPVPDRFPLRLTEGGVPRPATVAWRLHRRIGIAFES
ncbi:PilZ domain-containing protein [Methylobacterium sp. J-070]|uniref:PilZ domain-containing protein n=1 Tax=Methylobacterium sp. J-070 TaxID=2836650 RepID=UPI001FB86FC5|nr:PilZ domain-containing protein [Methylobacterium sp. J-070]MCJ2053582.1 PilZ domain-containing protein [Methylobacterium sp. J-070]